MVRPPFCCLLVGMGLMGTVRIAKHTKSNGFLAIKAISKDYVVRHNDARHVENERNLLRLINTSFAPGLLGESIACCMRFQSQHTKK